MNVILKLYLFVFLLFLSHVKSEEDKCYILALEGGNEKAAFGAGAIKGLVDNLDEKSRKWQVITGVSMGAINAAVISSFEKGQEAEAANYLIDELWNKIRPKDLHENWWFHVVEGFLWRNSLYNNSPLRYTLNKFFKDLSLKRDFTCGAVNLVSGEYKVWENKDLQNTQDLVEALMSTNSIPVFTPFNKFQDNYYIDGGWRSNIDMPSGIQKCLELGYEEKNIVIDVVMLSSQVLKPFDITKITPVSAYFRADEATLFSAAIGTFEEAQIYFPAIEIRYVVWPTQELPGGEGIYSFTHKEISRMIEIGQEDAKNVIKKGSGVNIQEAIKRHREEKRNRILGVRKTEINDEPIIQKEEESTPISFLKYLEKVES